MIIHPQIIKKNGEKEFVVIPYKEFIQIQELLEDFEDLKELRKEKKISKNHPTKSLDEVIKELDF